MPRVAIVTGGRDYQPTPSDRSALVTALQAHDITHVMHGACKGVDMWAHNIVKDSGRWALPVPALWGTHGKAAGPTRNAEMAAMADLLSDGWEPRRPPVCIVLPGGRGTADMAKRAEARSFEVVRIEAE